MKRHGLIIISSLVVGSVGAWGQATAEYGVAASKSAAATAAATDKLNRTTSGAVAGIGSKLDRTLGESTAKHKPAAVAPGSARAQTRPRAEQKALPATPATPAPETRTSDSSGMLVVGGSDTTQRPSAAKYPQVVDIGGASPAAKAASAPTKPKQ